MLNTALGIAIMSYDGHVFFGLLGDYDALADIDALAADLDAAIARAGGGAGAPVKRARDGGRRLAREARPDRRSPWWCVAAAGVRRR